MLGNVILSPAPGGAKDLPHALARPRPVTPMLGNANDSGRWFCAGLVRLRLPVCGGRGPTAVQEARPPPPQRTVRPPACSPLATALTRSGVPALEDGRHSHLPRADLQV